MPTERELADLAGMSDRELDLLLGEAELESTFGAKEAPDTEKIEIGRKVFFSKLPDIQNQICQNDTVSSLFASQHKERNDIIIALAGLLTGISPVPYVLAARILHYGYKQLCESDARN